jgi:hypothetical protein
MSAAVASAEAGAVIVRTSPGNRLGRAAGGRECERAIGRDADGADRGALDRHVHVELCRRTGADFPDRPREVDRQV